MKKLILSVALAASLGSFSALNAQDGGVFVGASVGLGMNARELELVSGNGYGSSMSLRSSLIYGARLGYIFSFNEMNALRLYGDFMAGEFFYTDNDSLYNMSAGGGLDYLLSFGGFGLYAGAGYHYTFGPFMRDLGSDANPHLPYVNLGMAYSVSFARFELGVKVPFMKYFDSNIAFVDNNGAILAIMHDSTYTAAQVYFNVDFVF